MKLLLIIGLIFFVPLYAGDPENEFQEQLLKNLGRSPEVMAAIKAILKYKADHKIEGELIVSGPTVVETVYLKEKAFPIPQLKLAFRGDFQQKQMAAFSTYIWDETSRLSGVQFSIDPVSPNEIPATGVILKENAGNYSIEPSSVLKKALAPEPIPPFTPKQIFTGPTRSDSKENYLGDRDIEILADLVLMKSLDPRVLVDSKFISQSIQQIHELRGSDNGEWLEQRFESQLSQIVRHTAKPSEFYQMVKKMGLDRFSDGTILPPPLKETPHFPSLMRVDHGQSLGQLTLKEGELVQKNGLKNPFLPYIGKALKDLPTHLIQQYFPHGFLTYHRTKNEHWKKSLLAGEIFVSLGKSSALGGAASWGEGVYLSLDPALLHYGNHLITIPLDPNAILGKDVDLFAGQTDGIVAIVKKQNVALDFQAEPNPEVIYPWFKKAVDEQKTAKAIELLRYLPLKRVQENHGADKFSTASPPLAFSLHLKGEKENETLQKWLALIQKRPELLKPDEREALARILVTNAPVNEKTKEQIVELFNLNQNPFHITPENLKQLNESLARLQKLVALNGPDVIIRNEVGMIKKKINQLAELFVGQLNSEMTPPSLGQILDATYRALTTLWEIQKSLEDNKMDIDGKDKMAIKEEISVTLEKIVAQVAELVQNRMTSSPQKTLKELLEGALLSSRKRVTSSSSSDKVAMLGMIFSRVSDIDVKVVEIQSFETILRKLFAQQKLPTDRLQELFKLIEHYERLKVWPASNLSPMELPPKSAAPIEKLTRQLVLVHQIASSACTGENCSLRRAKAIADLPAPVQSLISRLIFNRENGASFAPLQTPLDKEKRIRQRLKGFCTQVLDSPPLGLK